MSVDGLHGVRRIVLLTVMDAEAQSIVRPLGLQRDERAPVSVLPMRVFTGSRGGVSLTVVMPGFDERYEVELIGSQPAVLACHESIRLFEPDLVISAGTAGGFRSKGAAIGDVYLSRDSLVFHDRRIEIPGYREYGMGSYPCVDASAMAGDLGLKTGIVTTGNSLDLPEADLAMMRATGGEIKEMEAAGVAWTASLHGVPFMGVKVVTDLVDGDHPAHEEFLANLATACEALGDAVVRIVDWIGARAS